MPAGGEGKITISVNTAGYGGKSVKKNIVVYTNDKKKPKTYLAVRGIVEKIVDVRPNKVFLSGPSDKEISVSVVVVPEEKYPFNIKDVKAQNSNNIAVNLEKEKESNPKQYTLIVKNIATVKGKYYDWIIIRTDSSINNEIKIPVIGNIY
uniref:DUF1573 domain-containing protein n=1 Tax=uncultured Desulfobacterium sp. TaxID=201089 RepID=E1YGJ9_9BACT|nr:hypothetical protein N47_J06740 [uncultured Desulfobacterium sp.]